MPFYFPIGYDILNKLEGTSSKTQNTWQAFLKIMYLLNMQNHLKTQWQDPPYFNINIIKYLVVLS